MAGSDKASSSWTASVVAPISVARLMIDGEEQSAFLQGGIPRKQSFTLEFVRYGDDLQNR